MRRLIFVITAFMISVSYAQVDTLQLVEIGTVEAPSEITNLYIEDLDGDSLKEIILTTASNVHIYNGITYEPIWTSPGLDHPRDLLFADINLDGFIDFSVKDTSNIYLFDPHNDATIWTSPGIDSTYKCYTIGDRNDDDWVDVAMVSKEWFTRYQDSNNRDTVWTDLYDGPSFQDRNRLFILTVNWVMWGSGWYWQYNEIPSTISISRLSGNDGLFTRIVVFTRTVEAGSAPGAVVWNYILGNLWVINADDFAYTTMFDIGAMTHYEYIDADGSTYMHTLSEKYTYFRVMQDPHEDNLKRIVNSHSADFLLDSTLIWESNHDDSDWNGVIMENANYSYDGLELCFSADDSITLYTFPSIDHLWTTGGITDLDSIQSIFRAATLFENAQILCQIGNPAIKYEFYDGSDGSLSAILPDFGYPISKVADPNSDGNDEIFSLDYYILRIYGLQRMRAAGVVVVGLKALFYEWMRTVQRSQQFHQVGDILKAATRPTDSLYP